jgi:hypothetical protein
MPSTSKKQLNFFKLVLAFKTGGMDSFYKKWFELFKYRPLPDDSYIEKIKKTADTINAADLEDMASGKEGDDVLGDNREIKVGYYALFKGNYKTSLRDRDIKQGEFISKIKRVDNVNKIVNFQHGDYFRKDGARIFPPYRSKITSSEFELLDYAYFDDIIKTAKAPQELFEKRSPIFEEISNTIREIFKS